MNTYINKITSKKIKIPESIGGKAKNLFFLKQNGIKIPSGFVINSLAFTKHISKLKYGSITIYDYLRKIKKIDDINKLELKKIQNIIVNASIAEDIRKEISLEITKYLKSINFAVRSSAEVEDSDEFSWAGQFESFLNVKNSINQIEIAIKKVWASTFNYRSVSYCIQNNIISLDDIRMSVIIQEMVSEPQFSGVLFTESPITEKENSIYIEFVEGYGDKLVSGKINPYKLTIKRNKEFLDNNSIIQKNVLELLKEKSLIIENIFNKPQDIEWSISNNEIFFLQSRPITSIHHLIKHKPVAINKKPIIKGLPVSSGIGVGKSIIINNIQDATNIKKGEIIVAPMTNPDMVPYMRNSTAIVTDVGGMISHTAIVAREMSIPCIVGTSNATKIIKEGQVITVDGNTGYVYNGKTDISSDIKTIPEIINDISISFNNSFNKENVLYYYGISEIPNIKNYNKIVVNPYFFDLQKKIQKVRNVPLTEQKILLNEFISNLRKIITLSNSNIIIYKSEFIDFYNYDFLKNNKRIEIKSHPSFNRDININRNILTFAKTKDFFGHTPTTVIEGYPYPPRKGPWWPENWEYNWIDKSHNEKIIWGNIRPEIVNTPFTKSLIVQGIEKVPYIFNYNKLGPLYTKWKNCRLFVDINKLDNTRYKLAKSYCDNIQSFIDYIEQLHDIYNKWDKKTVKVKIEIDKQNSNINSLIKKFKELWKIHEDFFALCFLIQTIGDDIIWPKIQNVLSEVYEKIGIKKNKEFSSKITQVLASPTEKTLSKMYLEDLMLLKKEKVNHKSNEKFELLLKQHLKRWHWMRDRDLFYPPMNTIEKINTLLDKMELNEQNIENLWHSVFENNVRILEHFNLSKWFINIILIGNYLHIERENHHLIWVKNVDIMRDIILKIGDYLKSQKVITSENDIFFIQLPEIIKAIEEKDYSSINKKIIINRKKAFMHETKSENIEVNKIKKEIDYY